MKYRRANKVMKSNTYNDPSHFKRRKQVTQSQFVETLHVIDREGGESSPDHSENLLRENQSLTLN